MGVKKSLRKFSGGANMLHPKLTPWGIALIAASVIAILIGIAVGKYLLGKGKSVVGGMIPSAAGKDSTRMELGV
jgi:hypothetical protein